MTNTTSPRERALLLGTYDKDVSGARAAARADLAELAALATSAGADVRATILQPREHGRTGRIGVGKLDEVARAVRAEAVTLVVWADELTPHLAQAWAERLETRVIDRTELILDIFARRANSREGRLQVEMAQLTYRLPRLADRASGLSRTGGGIGTRGPGETRLEVDRRRIRQRLRRLEEDLARVDQERRVRRERRAAGLVPTVALVGYTNVGKSSLFQLITGRTASVEDQLFVTLDPGVRRVHVPGFGPALLIDTVGFVHRLPHTLVAAFKSTLDEVRDADLLLEVLDATEQGEHEGLVVDEVLHDVGAGDIPRIVVENKWDLARPGQEPRGIPISAATGWNQEGLLMEVARALAQRRAPIDLVVPWEAGEVLGWIRAEGELLDQRPGTEGLWIQFQAPPGLANRVQRRIQQAGPPRQPTA